MEIKTPRLNIDETLRYLGYKGGDIDDLVKNQLVEAERFLYSAARPRYTYMYNTALTLTGQDIAAHLDGCRGSILLAATLGLDVDRLIARAQITDMGLATIIDAAADSLIETVCDNVCTAIANEFPGEFLTTRFSPGYGDLPLDIQNEFCSALDTGRKIGLTVGSGGIMSPRKSVTAIVGLSPTEGHSAAKCSKCGMRDTCQYRRKNNDTN